MSWDVKLSRSLQLKSGKRLKTLSDVRALFLDRFANITHSPAIAHAGELLLVAAQTGELADIEAATDQIERALITQRLMG
jgi:hypothetical protein